MTPEELLARARRLTDPADATDPTDASGSGPNAPHGPGGSPSPSPAPVSYAGRRGILGIAGPPGAGKSTLAEYVAEALGPERAVLVPMDGFHLADVALRRLGRLDWKGAPDTFDAHGYAALLRRLREPRPGETVYAPGFDRELEQPLAGSIPVPPQIPLVITEGNYLLLDDAPWRPVRPLLDESWWVDLDPDLRVRRLIARHEQYGKEHEAAEHWVLRNDEQNAALVAPGREVADVVVEFASGDAPLPTGHGPPAHRDQPRAGPYADARSRPHDRSPGEPPEDGGRQR